MIKDKNNYIYNYTVWYDLMYIFSFYRYIEKKHGNPRDDCDMNTLRRRIYTYYIQTL